MKIAVPDMYLGRCESFTFIDVDNQTITNTEEVPAPPHEPRLLPRWLDEKGVSLIIAGGMGQRAQQLFGNQNIKVIIGAPAEEAQALVYRYLAGNLTTGTTLCGL